MNYSNLLIPIMYYELMRDKNPTQYVGIRLEHMYDTPHIQNNKKLQSNPYKHRHPKHDASRRRM